MLVRDLMKKDTEFCTLDDSALKAGEIMFRRNCGFVPIVKSWTDWTLEGVVTDRDLALYLIRTNEPASEVRIGEFCTRNLKTVFPDEDIHHVKALMEEAHVHRVPVVEHGGKLAGIISLKDLAEETWRDRFDASPQFTEKELAEILESIALSR